MRSTVSYLHTARSLFSSPASLGALSGSVLVGFWAALSYSSDRDLWLVLYVADAAVVLAAALCSNYLGVAGFFCLVAASGTLFTIAWSLQFSRFVFERASLSVELGPVSKLLGADIGLSLYVDYISYSFALLTALIATFVYFYAFSYMRYERNTVNFLVFFKLFAWSMILLVLSGSWFTMLLGWELIGITSFLLINFWSAKITTLKSAFKALVFNKVSDAALIGAVCLNLSIGATYINPSYAYANALAGSELSLGFASCSYASALLLLLVVASFCKSAQLGFHFWLPDSMEAPVPASALIHSATLVSAGIYLLLRFNSLFLVCDVIASVVMFLTAATAFYGAVIASFQTDVKKILAYSTISHCGMLIFSILSFSPFVTIFYLFAHGFFKSINFMCVGNYIQYSNNYQDVSRMGRFGQLFKFEFYMSAVTLFNLSSAPMFLCFFSKHWLIGLAYTNGLVGSASVCMVYAAAFCGMFYSSKLLYECSIGSKRAHSSVYAPTSMGSLSGHYRKSNALSRVPLALLVCVAFFVLLLLWSDALAGFAALADDYNTRPLGSYGSVFYATHVFFGFALALAAYCYFSYKVDGSVKLGGALAVLVLSALSALV